MKTLQQQKKMNFSTEKIDAATSMIQATIIPMAEIAAEYRAKKTELLSEGQFQIELLEGIVRPNVQDAINVTRKELQVAAEVLNTKELIQVQEKLIEENNTTISHKKSKIIELTNGGQLTVHIKRNSWLRRINWIEIAFYAIALLDGLFSYNNFRTAGFSKEVSGVMASFTVIAILIGRLLLIPWIQKSNGANTKHFRGAIAVVFMGIFFYFLSYYRTQGISQLSTDPSGLQVPQPAPSIWPQFIISYVLFLLVFFLHLFQWKSDTELMRHSAAEDTSNLINTLNEQIKKLDNQNEDAQVMINERKTQLRHLLDYYHKQIKILEHLGEMAIARYKKVYTGYAKSIPAFFLAEHKISYDTDLSFYSSENQNS